MSEKIRPDPSSDHIACLDPPQKPCRQNRHHPPTRGPGMAQVAAGATGPAPGGETIGCGVAPVLARLAGADGPARATRGREWARLLSAPRKRTQKARPESTSWTCSAREGVSSSPAALLPLAGLDHPGRVARTSASGGWRGHGWRRGRSGSRRARPRRRHGAAQAQQYAPDRRAAPDRAPQVRICPEGEGPCSPPPDGFAQHRAGTRSGRVRGYFRTSRARPALYVLRRDAGRGHAVEAAARCPGRDACVQGNGTGHATHRLGSRSTGREAGLVAAQGPRPGPGSPPRNRPMRPIPLWPAAVVRAGRDGACAGGSTSASPQPVRRR